MASKGLVIAGVAVVAGGLVTGVALAVAAIAVQGQTVEGFARAPVGCTTTLQFDTDDTFTLFVETKGRVADTGGDCEGSGATYSRRDDNPPRVELTLLDDGDGAVTLGDANDYTYDTGDFVGTSFATADITAAGTYRLTVSSEDSDFAIAIGRDPTRDSAIYLAAGITIAGLAVLIGVLLVVLGVLQKSSTPTAGTGGVSVPWSGRAGPSPLQPGSALPPPTPLGSWPVSTPVPPSPSAPTMVPPAPPEG
jgi:hypothetical protein